MFLKAETASGDECEHRQHAYKPSDGKHKYKHRLCAQVIPAHTTVNPQSRVPKSEGRQCRSCKRSLQTEAFDQGRATCRWCLAKKKSNYWSDEATAKFVREIWDQESSTNVQVASQLLFTCDYVCDQLSQMAPSVAIAAISDLSLASEELETAYPLQMVQSPQNTTQLSQRLVSMGEVSKACCLILGLTKGVLIEHIHSQQQQLWDALEHAVKAGADEMKLLPVLVPSGPIGPATLAIIRSASANACRDLSITVLQSAIQELSGRVQDTSRLSQVLEALLAIPEVHPTLATTPGQLSIEDPTLTGMMQYSEQSQMCTSERAAEAFNTFKEWATHKSIFVKFWC